MNLSDEQKNKIKEHALKENPKECCGLILSDESLLEMENKSFFPEDTFYINFEDLPNELSLDQIKAFYHSHPLGGEKSSIDMYFSHKRNLPFIIYDLQKDSFSQYSPKGFYELPLIGRDFLTNEIDCITLVIDYYKRNLNLEIQDIVHPIREIEPNNWKNHTEFWKYNRKDNITFVELFQDRGFRIVPKPQEHDLVLSDNGLIKALSHVGVYLNDDMVIHHPYPAKSIKQPFINFKRDSQILFMRHNSI